MSALRTPAGPPQRPLLAAALALAAGAALVAPEGPRSDRDGALVLGLVLALGSLAAGAGLPPLTALAAWLCLPVGALRAAAVDAAAPIEGAEAWTQPGEGSALLAGVDAGAPPTERALWPATGPFTPALARRPIAWFPHPDEVVRLTPAVGQAVDAAPEGPAEGPTEGPPAEVDEESMSTPSAGVNAPWMMLVGELRETRATGLARLAAADEDHEHMGLLAALLLGDRSEVAPEIGEHFTRTGTRHLLALSGLHVGLVAWLLGRPLARFLQGAVAALWPARLRRPRVIGPAAFLALLALAFIPLAGSGAPAARAAVALAVAALGDLVGPGAARGRRPDTRSLWGLALGLEVLVRPTAPLDLGVQLSYGATLALLLAYGPVRAGLGACLPNRGSLAAVDRAGRSRPAMLRVPGNVLLGYGLSALAVGAVATLATLPMTWARFGEWSPIGVVATPLVMPAVTVALVSGYAWLAAPQLVPLALPDRALEAAVRVLAWCDGWPGTPWLLPPASLAALLPPTVAAVGLVAGSGRIRRRWLAGGGSAVALWFTLVAAGGRAPLPTDLEVVQFDVGRGQAAVLRAPGSGVWVVDAGTVERAGLTSRALGPLLRAWGARDVHVVLTRADRAHGSALPWLTSRFRVPVWLGAAPEELERALAAQRGGKGLRESVGTWSAAAGTLVWRTPGGLELELSGTAPGPLQVRARWRAGDWHTISAGAG